MRELKAFSRARRWAGRHPRGYGLLHGADRTVLADARWHRAALASAELHHAGDQAAALGRRILL